MKNIFLLSTILLFALHLLAQENDSIVVVKSPAGRLSGLIDIQDLVNEGFNFWSDEFEGHWAGVEFGVNGFAKDDYSMYPANQRGFLDNDLLRSNVLNLNILQFSKGLQKTRNTVGLVTGLGLSLQSYHLDANSTIELDENNKIQPKQRYFDSSQKSKFSMVYLEVPLLAEFQIPIEHYANRLYFSGGINLGVRLSAHTKIKYTVNNKKEKLKTTGDFSMSNIKASATLRMGYRWINLFAAYDLVPLFVSEKGPVLYPFSVGVKLISF